MPVTDAHTFVVSPRLTGDELVRWLATNERLRGGWLAFDGDDDFFGSLAARRLTHFRRLVFSIAELSSSSGPCSCGAHSLQLCASSQVTPVATTVQHRPYHGRPSRSQRTRMHSTSKSNDRDDQPAPSRQRPQSPLRRPPLTRRAHSHPQNANERHRAAINGIFQDRR